MQQQIQSALEVRIIGTVPIAPGGVIVVDPLTFSPAPDWPEIPTSEGPAQFIVALDAGTGHVSKAMLLFETGPVACGRVEATVGIVSGLAAFLDQPAAAALAADYADFDARGQNLYVDWLQKRFGDADVIADRFPLPSGPEIPIASSGWGVGDYPVASLHDADGSMLALYVDFMGKNAEGEWLLPGACKGPDVTRNELPSFPPSNL